MEAYATGSMSTHLLSSNSTSDDSSSEEIFIANANMSTHLLSSNSTSDDSSSPEIFIGEANTSTHFPRYNEPSHPANTNTNTNNNTVSQSNNNPTLKEKKKKKKKAVADDEIRLLCSYGGKIVVDTNGYRSYCGGENRLILVERRCSVSNLLRRLSTNVFQLGQPDRFFTTLKYQLRHQDYELNCLITIRTDEDLQNMIKEYDHVNRRRRHYDPLNLRLFLFRGGF